MCDENAKTLIVGLHRRWSSDGGSPVAGVSGYRVSLSSSIGDPITRLSVPIRAGAILIGIRWRFRHRSYGVTSSAASHHTWVGMAPPKAHSTTYVPGAGKKARADDSPNGLASA